MSPSSTRSSPSAPSPSGRSCSPTSTPRGRPVQSVSELLDDPQVEANGYVGDVVIDGEPAYRLPAVPVQFDGQAPPLRRAPEHGEDTESLLIELGYGWDADRRR